MRDYIKNPSSRAERSSRHGDVWFSNLMLILAIIFLICAICHFTEVDLGWMAKKPAWLSLKNIEAPPEPIEAKKPLSTSKTHAQKAAKKSPPSSKTTVADNQPHYDFYKLLPEMSVDVSQENTTSD